MTNIQSQLDQVLAPCPFCDSPAKFGQVPFEPQTDDSGAYYIACTNKVCDAGMGFRFACGEDPRPQMAAQWNKRAAVGGEAVGWQYLDASDDEWRETLCPNVWRDAGVSVRAIYASPAATVDVGALRELVPDPMPAHVRKFFSRDTDYGEGVAAGKARGYEECRIEVERRIAALIGEKA